mgnify:CR=1 FL=1
MQNFFMNKSLLMGYFPTSIISLGTYPMSAVWCQRMTGKLGLGLLAPIVPSCMKPNGKELDVGVNVLQIFLHSDIIAGNVHWYWSRLWPELFSPLKKKYSYRISCKFSWGDTFYRTLQLSFSCFYSHDKLNVFIYDICKSLTLIPQSSFYRKSDQRMNHSIV